MFIGWRNFDDTWRTLDLLQHRIDRAFADPADPRLFASPRSWRRRIDAPWPATNVLETKEALVITADLPGVADSEVTVTVEDDTLVIRGERKAPVPPGYKTIGRQRAPVVFTRKLVLPIRVDAGAVTATLNLGVLTVTLPKAKEALPRQIAVKAL